MNEKPVLGIKWKFEMPWGWLTAVVLTLFFSAWGYDSYLTNKQTHANDGKPYTNSFGETRVPLDGEMVVYTKHVETVAVEVAFEEVAIRRGGWQNLLADESRTADVYRVYSTGGILKLQCIGSSSNCDTGVVVGHVSPSILGEIPADSLMGIIPDQYLRMLELGRSALNGQRSFSAIGQSSPALRRGARLTLFVSINIGYPSN